MLRAALSGALARLTRSQLPIIMWVRRRTAQSQPLSLSRPLTRIVSVLAMLAAVAVGLLPPLTYVFGVYARQQGMLETRSVLYAAEVADAARQDPSLWNALVGPADSSNASGAQAATADEGDAPPDERRAIYAQAGMLVRQSIPTQSMPWPTLSVRAPVFDGHNQIGQVEISRSLRDSLAMMTAVAVGSLLFGSMIFVMLRLLPLKLLREAIQRITYLSAHDVLTGLPNRSLFSDRLELALAMTRRQNGQVAVLYLDLDKFKEVNDTLGHPAGDALLRAIAARLKACVRETDLIARLGGDEFAVIQSHIGHLDDTRKLAQRMIDAVAPPLDLGGHQVNVAVSIGITVSTIEPGVDPAQMMQEADIALYRAKESHKGSYCFFQPEMNLRLRERRAMETDLREAVSNDALFLYYQPQIDLQTGQIIGAEALLRWDRPGHGQISPACFIPLAEDMGLIGAIGGRLLREACFEAMTWPVNAVIAVNVSPLQMRLPDFYNRVMGALGDSGLAPWRLELEVTEGVLMQSNESTLATLARLRQAGIHLAMDDFGTGYSSLSYLQTFRFDKIKIDRAFISRIGDDAEAIAIVRAIIGLSKSLRTKVIAEGVETEMQARLLRAEHCDEVQGFLFGKPMSAERLRTLLANQSLSNPTDTFEASVAGLFEGNSFDEM